MAEFSIAIERDVDLGRGCRDLFATMVIDGCPVGDDVSVDPDVLIDALSSDGAYPLLIGGCSTFDCCGQTVTTELSQAGVRLTTRRSGADYARVVEERGASLAHADWHTSYAVSWRSLLLGARSFYDELARQRKRGPRAADIPTERPDVLNEIPRYLASLELLEAAHL